MPLIYKIVAFIFGTVDLGMKYSCVQVWACYLSDFGRYT